MASQVSARKPDQPTADAVPAARSSWSGQIQIGTFIVPVKAYPAFVTTPASPLHQFHARCGGRIEYRKCCPKHGHVPNDGITKGYAYAVDEVIELDAADLAQLQPSDDKTIRLERFVRPEQVDLAFLSGRSMHLVPANPVAEKGYAMVLKALEKQKAWGIGQMVLSARRQLVIVRAIQQKLVLHVLHWPAQRRVCPFSSNGSVETTAKQVRQLEKVIADKTAQLRWAEYVDDYEARLTKLVQAKADSRRARTIPMNGKRRAKTSVAPGGRKTSTRKTSTRRKTAAA